MTASYIPLQSVSGSLATSKPQIAYEPNNHRDYRFWTLTGDVSLSISYVSHYYSRLHHQFYLEISDL